jgi:hypothetical protein
VTPFEFVAVFFSVVLGLAVSHLLTGLSDLVEVRQRVRTDWIHSLWVVAVLLLLVHSWWGMWDLSSGLRWTYPAFLVLVANQMASFLLATLTLPRVPADEGPIDLGAHLAHVRPIFLSLWGVILGLAALENRALFKVAYSSVFFIGPLVLAAVTGAGVRVRNRGYQASLVLFFLVLEVYLMAIDTSVLT